MKKVNKLLKMRALPDIFDLPSGEKVQTVSEWETLARPHLKGLLLEQEYGQFPPVVTPTVTVKTNKIDFAGKAVWEEVTFRFEYGGKAHEVPTQLIFPKDGENHPFFISLQFEPQVPNKYLPTEEILDRGFGVFSVCYEDVTRDNPDFSDGLAGLFSSGERLGDEAGKIVYWSYMASRMMDYLLTRKEAQSRNIGVIGHSRLGKTALLTAAFDERFAAAFANNSGCSGAALSRGTAEKGEHIHHIYATFPYWFCKNYAKYQGAEETLPFDQHALIALIAPRQVVVGAAEEDVWADNDGQFLSLVAADKAWKLHEKRGLICPDRLPVSGDKWFCGDCGFFLRDGKHFLSRFDWNAYIDAWKR